jgi:hypothetical protein
MLSLRQRLKRLERSPVLQHPPVDPIVAVVVRQLSDADLELLIGVARDREAGVCQHYR